MIGRRVILAAVALYVAIALGCVLSGQGDWKIESAGSGTVSTGASLAPAEHLSRLPLRGAGMQIQRIDWIEEYQKSVDEIAAAGADAVLLVVDARMENGSSSRIYLDMRMTPSPEQLGRLIRHAKQKNLRVVLMPIVLLDNPRTYTEWRGTISPEDWAGWWDSYRSMLYHYCWIAQGSGVDVLVVGSELVSTESKAEEWRRTIAMVRQHYRGMLTYSSNWDHYHNIPFWDQLDLVGMNSYWKLGNDHTVSVEEIQQRWAEIQRNVLGFIHKVRKPLLFLEVGWCSLRNAAHEPWDYTQESVPIDLDLQRKLYEGFFRSWYGIPELGGFMIWEWTPGNGGPNHRGYTPEGKPAEQVLRQWLAKPAWRVY